MRVRIELGLYLLGLQAAVVLLGLGSVALFERMSPAIQHILAENVVTLEATEQMLLARVDPSLSNAEARRQFQAGLDVAKANVTEEMEGPLLEEITQLAPRAFEDPKGPMSARLAQKLNDLAEVNRKSMRQEAAEARRLGLAGGWAVVLVALLILGLTIALTRRLEQRVVGPLVAMAAKAEMIRSGNVYLRCPAVGPPELQEVSKLLNELLDDQRTPARTTPLAQTDRRLVLHLLDQRPGHWLAIDESGVVLACNKGTLDRIQSSGAPSQEVLQTLRGAEDTEAVGNTLWLLRWPSDGATESSAPA